MNRKAEDIPPMEPLSDDERAAALELAWRVAGLVDVLVERCATSAVDSATEALANVIQKEVQALNDILKPDEMETP